MEMSEFTYLTFDCYGTLIDWKTGIVDSLEKSFGSLAIGRSELMGAYVEAEKKEEGEYKKYRQVLRETFERLASEMGVRAPVGASEKFAESVPDWPAFQDTTASMRKLGEMGYKRYILSNVDEDILRATMARNRFQIDGAVTAEEVGSYKPSPAHWERFFQKTGAKKSEVLHVAQSIYHDIVPTQGMGVASAWVNRYGEALPANVQPLYIVDSLESLVEILG
jgi:2-haloalkanoic acid dehalogenase type II